MAGILSQGTGMTGGMLAQRQPQSMLQRLGIGLDFGSPDNQVPMAFLSNVISTPDVSTFRGVGTAAQNAQVMNQRKTELSQIVKKQQQEDQQSQQLKQMLAGDPMATQFLLAGQPDAAMKIYEHNKGLDATPEDPYTLGPGQTRFGPGGSVLASVPAADASTKPPTVVSIYDSNGREQKGYMNGGQFMPLGNPKADTPRPEYTQSQALSAGYADRMAQSDAILSDPKLTSALMDQGKQIESGIPLGIGNALVGPEFQQADQAKRDFLNAILRRESGAVVSPSEFDNGNRQYFPQPNDGPEVLKQKAANRRNAINGVARGAGPAYQPPDTTNYLDDPSKLNNGGVDDLLKKYGVQ